MVSFVNKFPKYRNRGGYRYRGIKNTYSNKSSPLLTGVINILVLTLTLILIINCANIMKNYNDINNYRRQLAAKEREDLRSVEASSANVKYNNEEKQIAVSATLPSIMPCQGTITSGFGGRTLSISRGKSEFHSGLDIANSTGTEIKAVADGVVEFSGWQDSYGNVVYIKHDDTYTTIYGHNSKLLVRKGDAVKKGQIISLMGSTGRSTGPHCHFEIRVNNKAVNPLDIIKIK